MIPQSKALLMFAILVALSLGATTIAQADPLTLTIDNPVQAGEPGSPLFFNGIITNVSSTPVTFGSWGFLAPGIDFPGLPPGCAGANSGLDFFPHTLLPTESLSYGFGILLQTPGTYSATFVVGPWGGFVLPLEVLGRVDFQFTVQQAPTAVPEPATILLLGTALTGITLRARRRSKPSTKHDI